MDNNTANIEIPDITAVSELVAAPKTTDEHIFIVIKKIAFDGNNPRFPFEPIEWTSTCKNKSYEFKVDISNPIIDNPNAQYPCEYYNFTITKTESGNTIETLSKKHVSSYNVSSNMHRIMFFSPEKTMQDLTEDYHHYTENNGIIFIATDDDLVRNTYIQNSKRISAISKQTDYMCPVIKNGHDKIKTENKTLLPYKNGEGVTICAIENILDVSYNNEEWNLTKQVKLRAFANILVGKTGNTYRNIRGKFIPCELWDVLNISTKNTWSGVDYTVTDLLDWLSNNASIFLKYSKFLDFLITDPDTTGKGLPISTRFTTLLLMLWYYPQVSLILSMGDFHIIHTIENKITSAQNKATMKSAIMELFPLFNEDATEGNKALTMPKHISSFLEKKEASLETYYAWTNIVELLPNLRDKNQFDTFIHHPFYIKATNTYNRTSTLYTFTDIFKYGYTNWKKLFRYLEKQSTTNTSASENFNMNEIRTTITYMKDYLNMCDFLNVPIDPYPNNLKQVHDRLSMQKNDAINENTERFLDYLGTACEKATSNIKNEKYCVVFPKKVQDFTNEGQCMSNCVGGYYRNVIDGYDIVFFIRRKSNPDISYVTGEYLMSTKQINQLHKAHNTSVNNPEVIAFAKEIEKSLRKIPSLRIADVISQSIN